jgi:hypothetical protein
MPYMIRYDLPPTEREPIRRTEPLAGQCQGNWQRPKQSSQDDWQPDDPTKPLQGIETIYVTMSTTDPQRHIRLSDVGNVIMACLAIAMLLTFVVMPDAPLYTTKTLTVPAILLPVRTITVSVPITATGVKTYPATSASGTLTITNGGSLTEYIQTGFLLTSTSGVEVATDQGVTVPAGNGESYGVTTVSAHSVVAGSSGNIPAYSINRTYGTDLFIKNLTAFMGGQDAYSVRFVTDQDKQTALSSASTQIDAQRPAVLLLKPCVETTSEQAKQVSVTLTCQPITYHAPAGMQVVSVRVQGMSVVLTYKTLLDAGT